MDEFYAFRTPGLCSQKKEGSGEEKKSGPQKEQTGYWRFSPVGSTSARVALLRCPILSHHVFTIVSAIFTATEISGRFGRNRGHCLTELSKKARKH